MSVLAPVARRILIIVYALFSLALCLRCFAGREVTFPVAVGTPLNVEGFVAIAFLLVLFFNSEECRIDSPVRTLNRHDCVVLGISFCVCLIAFSWSLSSPLLFDDYGHIQQASQASWQTVRNLFLVQHSDTAFRPIGFLSYLLDFQWARFDPFRWHVSSLLIHVANCCLTYFLTRQLGFSRLACTASSLVFAVSGTRAEPVCWTDARFDLIATLFVLIALASLLRYQVQASPAWLAIALGASLLAFCTKESSFCLPILAVLVLSFRSRLNRNLIRSAVVPLFLLSALTFLYRYWMVGGIGGYYTQGHADVLNFSPIRTIKAVAWRTWASLLFPINWTAGTGLLLSIALMLMLVCLGWTMFRVRVSRRGVLPSIAITMAAGLPVQHLLLLSPDLSGARFLYLPALGLCLLFGLVIDGLNEQAYAPYVALSAITLFNLIALEHNISAWREVAQASRRVCSNFGKQIENLSNVSVSGLPSKYKGVYFLSNGFPQCVELNSGVPGSRITVLNGADASRPAGPWFTWDATLFAFRRMQ